MYYMFCIFCHPSFMEYKHVFVINIPLRDRVYHIVYKKKLLINILLNYLCIKGNVGVCEV